MRMLSESGFKKVPLNAIGEGLLQQTAMLGGEESATTGRSRTCNFIILASFASDEERKGVSELVSELVGFHPGRFFVVEIDESLSTIESAVTVLFSDLSKIDRVWSEIIGIRSPTSQIKAIPSVIRANLLASVPTELYWYHSRIPLTSIAPFYSIFDLLIFDSQEVIQNFLELERLLKSSISLVDLRWLDLTCWRDQIKSVFDRPVLKNSIKQYNGLEINEIFIKGSSSCKKGVFNSASLLMAGWLLSRLNVAVVGYGAGSYECKTHSGRLCRLKLSEDRGRASAGKDSQLVEVRLSFKGHESQGSKKKKQPDMKIELKRDELLETTIESESLHKISCPLDLEMSSEKLRRFFLIGESTANYPAALSTALELERLRQGFGLN